VRHHPKLWKYCHCTDKEAAHPESIKERAFIEVTVEQASENEGSQCKRYCWKVIVASFVQVRPSPNVHHTVHEPENHDQRQNIEGLVQEVT